MMRAGIGTLALSLLMVGVPGTASAGKRHHKSHGKSTGAGASAATASGKSSAASPAPTSGAGKSGAGQDVELSDDPLPGVGDSSAPAGSEENPNAPTTAFTTTPAVAQAAARAAAPAPYPIELVLRPLTLPRHMIEVSFSAPDRFNPYIQSGVLAGHIGLDDRMQVGLRYGVGTVMDGSYYAGKAFAIDGEYRIAKVLSAEISIPLLVDPFSFGVTLGAPLKYTLFDKLSFLFGRDLITFKVARFAPSVDNAAENQLLADLDAANTSLPDGELAFNFGLIWQQQPNLAIDAHLGIHSSLDAEADTTERDAIPLDLGLTYSTSNKVDVGGRIGFFDLNNTSTSFGVSLLAAMRI